VRRRKAENLRAGPKNEYGGCIGMSFRELQYEYTRAVFIGIVEPNMTKEAMATRGYGLCPDPDTVIKKSDMLIFVGPKSSPARDRYTCALPYTHTRTHTHAHSKYSQHP